MEIRNVTEFAGFLSGNGFQNKDTSFAQIINCVNALASACNCYSKEEKMDLIRSCNGLYRSAAHIAAHKLKSDFLSKTSDRQILFYTDAGELITIVSR